MAMRYTVLYPIDCNNFESVLIPNVGRNGSVEANFIVSITT